MQQFMNACSSVLTCVFTLRLLIVAVARLDERCRISGLLSQRPFHTFQLPGDIVTGDFTWKEEKGSTPALPFSGECAFSLA